MPRGEITINYQLCQGCGLCVQVCNRGCIVLSAEKLSDLGSPQALFTQPERCTACCLCAWLCPDFAIEVYRLSPAPP